MTQTRLEDTVADFNNALNEMRDEDPGSWNIRPVVQMLGNIATTLAMSYDARNRGAADLDETEMLALKRLYQFADHPARRALDKLLGAKP